MGHSCLITWLNAICYGSVDAALCISTKLWSFTLTKSCSLILLNSSASSSMFRTSCCDDPPLQLLLEVGTRYLQWLVGYLGGKPHPGYNAAMSTASAAIAAGLPGWIFEWLQFSVVCNQFLLYLSCYRCIGQTFGKRILWPSTPAPMLHLFFSPWKWSGCWGDWSTFLQHFSTGITCITTGFVTSSNVSIWSSLMSSFTLSLPKVHIVFCEAP